MRIRSTPGKGTLVLLRLPLDGCDIGKDDSAEMALDAKEASAVPLSPAAGRG
jgi:hypothetical protein